VNIIENIERQQLRENIPQFKAGDTVKVHFKVIEGTRQRIQVFQGIVIKRQGEGARETFTVRKQSFGVGVELRSPSIRPRSTASRCWPSATCAAPSSTTCAARSVSRPEFARSASSLLSAAAQRSSWRAAP
jgi:ribosomal protein L19